MLKQAILYRTYTQNITFGHLLYDNEFVCHFFELPWRNNKKEVSCIPEGEYHFKIIDRHERLGLCYYCETKIKGRSEIFIHVANTTNEIKGCLVSVTTLRSDVGGDSSKVAMLELRRKLGDEFILKITVPESKGIF